MSFAERGPAQAPLLSGRPGEEPLDLREIDLREGAFAGADLRDADLRHAQLELADLSGACLQGARLDAADLTLADLRGADLRGADLSGADLSGADLRDADFSGADLTTAHLPWSRLTGARGLPDELKALPRDAEGRVKGQQAGGGGEPAQGLAAWEQGRRAHHEGRLGEAERHYRLALAWVPDSGATCYGLGCVALERRDPEAAARWWKTALKREPEADRARVDGAILAIAESDWHSARDLLEPLLRRDDKVGRAAAAARANLAAGAPEAAVGGLSLLVQESPALRWHARQTAPLPPPPPPRVELTERLADQAWVASERADLEQVLRTSAKEAWVWHSAIARAITIGAMDLAALAEQRLHRVAPEHRLWGIELRQLDQTGEAFAALVKTRRQRIGRIEAIRWVAIGAHGPTAMLVCEGGVFYAKRYVGAVRPAASVAFTHRICRDLSERGLRVPLPIGDSQGDDVMVFGTDLLALYPDLGGQSIRDEDIDIASAEQAGQLLANIHTVGAQMALGGGRPSGGIRVGTRILRQTSPAGAWQLQMARRTDCAARLDLHPLRSRLDSLLTATGRRLGNTLERCPMTLVHGDFGPGNVLSRSDGEAWATIDWDLADFDLAVWDLARAIDRLAVHWPTESGRPTEIRANVAAAMLRGYSHVRALSGPEQTALPLLIAASRIDLDASVLPLCVPLEPDSAEPILASMLARLSRAAAGAPELAHALAAGRWLCP